MSGVTKGPDRKKTPDDEARGERLKKLRVARGLTQEQAADLMDRKRDQLSKIESGWDRFTSPESQSKLASVYKVPVGPLVEYARGMLQLDELLASRESTRIVEMTRRYPELEEAKAHLRARGEDPAVIAALEDMAIARHGNYSAEDLPALLTEARARVKRLDAAFGFDVPAMKRPTTEESKKPKAKRQK